MRAVRPVLLAAASLLLAGCNGTNAGTTALDDSLYTVDPATTSFADTLKVTISSMTKTASGLYYKDLVTGTGATAAAGYTVRVGYTGWLVNGQQFDTSYDDPNDTSDDNKLHYFEFLLNAGSVIKGWDEGVRGMKVGGRRQLVIPPGLAYGVDGSGSIPANAVLVFEIELLQVR